MALPTIKTTYTLTLETRRQLDQLAALWSVSKSEALRRAVHLAAGGANRVAALEALQQRVGLTGRAADRWARDVRAERRAATHRARAPR